MDTPICQCLTQKGMPCKLKPLVGEKYCRIHKDCQRPSTGKSGPSTPKAFNPQAFGALPAQLADKIFGYLPRSDILTMRSVSKGDKGDVDRYLRSVYRQKYKKPEPENIGEVIADTDPTDRLLRMYLEDHYEARVIDSPTEDDIAGLTRYSQRLLRLKYPNGGYSKIIEHISYDGYSADGPEGELISLLVVVDGKLEKWHLENRFYEFITVEGPYTLVLTINPDGVGYQTVITDQYITGRIVDEPARIVPDDEVEFD